jgi:hypothetical protein
MVVLPLPLVFAFSLLVVGTSPSRGAALGLDGLNLLSDAQKIEDWIINIRRELHQHPELMFQVRVYIGGRFSVCF